MLSAEKVGILDVDIHGPSIAKMLGIEGRAPGMEDGRPLPIHVFENIYAVSIASFMPNNDDPLIWRGPMKMTAIKQFLNDIKWPELDYLVIDCPPGTGDEPLSVIQLIKAVTGSVIVSTPQDVAFLDARKTLTFSQKLNVPVLGIIENMAGFTCPHCGEKVDIFEGTGAKKAAKDFDVDILGSIPIDVNIGKSSDAGRPYIYDYGKLPGAEEMRTIVDKILEKTDKI